MTDDELQHAFRTNCIDKTNSRTVMTPVMSPEGTPIVTPAANEKIYSLGDLEREIKSGVNPSDSAGVNLIFPVEDKDYLATPVGPGGFVTRDQTMVSLQKF